MRKDVNKIALQAFETVAKESNPSIINRLLTQKEKVVIGKRLLVTQAILAGKTRFEINEKIGVSPNTFAQINRWLETDLDEYTSAAKPKQRSRKDISRYIKPFSYEYMKRKYPAHFLLFALVEDLWKRK